jgi:hypothetical protein
MEMQRSVSESVKWALFVAVAASLSGCAKDHALSQSGHDGSPDRAEDAAAQASSGDATTDQSAIQQDLPSPLTDTPPIFSIDGARPDLSEVTMDLPPQDLPSAELPPADLPAAQMDLPPQDSPSAELPPADLPAAQDVPDAEAGNRYRVDASPPEVYPGAEAGTKLCPNRFSQNYMPCCPETPPNCQDMPNGYPGYECTPDCSNATDENCWYSSAYCACDCREGRWLCGC